VGDAARGHRGRNNELPLHDLSANRRGAPSAICLLSFCAGGLRGAERQHRDEREDKPRADAEARAAKPHRARMARGQSRRIGRSAHFQLRQVLSSGGVVMGFVGRHLPNPCPNAQPKFGSTRLPKLRQRLAKPLPVTSPDQSPTPLLGEGGSLPSPNRVSASSSRQCLVKPVALRCRGSQSTTGTRLAS